MPDSQISPADPHPRKKLELIGTWISYADTGAGDPIVFLHGNPTSSYLWRNVIPHLASLGRCVAPDLVGMGASGPSATGAYRFEDHARHLDAFFEGLNLERKVTLVVHDWGSALGFHWAARHPEAVKGIAYMEAIVRPLQWSEWSQAAVAIFKALRSPAGDDMILKNNIFVERILPGSILRKLSDEEMNAYRKTFIAARRVAASDANVAARNSNRRRACRTSLRSPTIIRSGSKKARRRSCSSMPTPARFLLARSASTAAVGRISAR